MKFYDWIEKLSKDDTPSGELARNILNDKDFPKEAKDWNTISSHLSKDEETQRIASTAFENYLNEVENR